MPAIASFAFVAEFSMPTLSTFLVNCLGIVCLKIEAVKSKGRPVEAETNILLFFNLMYIVSLSNPFEIIVGSVKLNKILKDFDVQ